MKTSRALLVGAVLLAAAPLRAGLKEARAKLNAGDPQGAIAQYSGLRTTRHPDLAAEYAYALSLAGFKDLALGHLDQALALLNQQRTERSGTVTFFAARVYGVLGVPDIAQELAAQAGPAPDWLTLPEAPGRPLEKAQVLDVASDLSVANGLLLQKRYFTAADRFQRVLLSNPSEPTAYAGLAIALERIGAYRKASRAVAKSVELGRAKLTPEQAASQTSYQKELEARPQTPPSSAPVRAVQQSLKGRYLAFVGGNLNRTKESTVSSFNSRLGKFLTNKVDVSLTAGYTGGNINKDYRGPSVGLGVRYSQPLPISAPLNITSGARVQYNPRPTNKTSVIASPGLSWVFENGSFDVVVDYGVSGPLKKTNTISLGFTTYLGGRR